MHCGLVGARRVRGGGHVRYDAQGGGGDPAGDFARTSGSLLSTSSAPRLVSCVGLSCRPNEPTFTHHSILGRTVRRLRRSFR